MNATRFTRRFAATGLATLIFLSGCQTVGSLFPQHDKVTDARNAKEQETVAPADEPITPEKTINIQLALGQSFEEEKQPDQAAKIYLDIIKKDPRNVVAYHRLALLHAKQGEWEPAQKYFDLAVKYAPKDVVILCDQGYCYYLQRRNDPAEACYRRAIALDASYACAHNDLGLLLARRGREDEALKEFKQAGCHQAQAQANLAMAYSMENRLADAQLHYRLALAADPNLGLAKSGLAALESVDRNRVRMKDGAVSPLVENNLAAPIPTNVALQPATNAGLSQSTATSSQPAVQPAMNAPMPPATNTDAPTLSTSNGREPMLVSPGIANLF